MTKVYMVMKNGGNLEDTWEHVEKAFFDEVMANDFKDNKNIWLKEQIEIQRIKEATNYSDEEYKNMTDEEYNETVRVNYTLLYDQCPFYIKVIEVE